MNDSRLARSHTAAPLRVSLCVSVTMQLDTACTAVCAPVTFTHSLVGTALVQSRRERRAVTDRKKGSHGDKRKAVTDRKKGSHGQKGQLRTERRAVTNGKKGCHEQTGQSRTERRAVTNKKKGSHGQKEGQSRTEPGVGSSSSLMRQPA